MTTQYVTSNQPGIIQPNVVVQPNVVYTATAQPRPTIADRYNARAANQVAILITAFGCLSVIFGIVAIVIQASLYTIGVGIWCGIGLYIVTGVLGILASRTKQSGLITAFMVMCILTVSFGCLTMLIITSIGTGVDDTSRCYGYYFFSTCDELNSRKGQLAINAILLTITLVEGILCIVGSTYGCSATCCYGSGSPATTIQTSYVIGQPGTTVIQTQQQPYYSVPQGSIQGQMQPPYSQAAYNPGQAVGQMQPPYSQAAYNPGQAVVQAPPYNSQHKQQGPPPGYGQM